jgi:hypothetical protein
MARRQPRPAAARAYRLEPFQRRCAHCGGPAHVAYYSRGRSPRSTAATP